MPDDQHAPEGVIPPPELLTPATNKADTSPQGPWRHVKSWGTSAVKIFTGVSSVVVGAFILATLGVFFTHRNSLDLDTILVPETLSKAGFTSEVATRHLRDAIYAVQERATTRMSKAGVDTDQDLSEITIPKTGLSLQSVAVAVRSLLPGWRREVSGEFIQSGSEILLRLRVNGKVIFSETGKDIDPSTADALLGKDVQGGAFRVVEESQPFVAASALYGDGNSSNLTAADKEADHIIALYPVEDENVVWARNLKGLIAKARGDDAGAEAFYKKVPRLASARSNLGLLYQNQHKPDMAIAQYQAAIWLNPKLAVAHYNLGNLYSDYHYNPEIAIAEYQEAIWLDPKYAVAHNNLGNVYYYEQGKPEMAIAEYQAAIQIDPKDASSHYNLGLSLRDTAASSGTGTERAKRLEDACRAFVEGSKLAPNNPDYPARMHDIDSVMNGGGHCPPK